MAVNPLIIDTQRAAADASRQVVSATAIAKSGRVLYAFAHFYFPFYGREPRDLFWQYEPFAWISAFVYDVDEEIERGRPPEETLCRLDDLSMYLSSRIVIDPKVMDLFNDARRYYCFEYDVTRRAADYSLDDLVQMTSVRSFDFRLLHRVLAQRSGAGYREELFDWFRALEMLMEIEDDIVSVKEDGRRQTFNVVCLAIRRAPDTAAAFVEQLRRRVEDTLLLRRERLSHADRDLCARTLESYREVVRRPVFSEQEPM